MPRLRPQNPCLAQHSDPLVAAAHGTLPRLLPPHTLPIPARGAAHRSPLRPLCLAAGCACGPISRTGRRARRVRPHHRAPCPPGTHRHRHGARPDRPRHPQASQRPHPRPPHHRGGLIHARRRSARPMGAARPRGTRRTPPVLPLPMPLAHRPARNGRRRREARSRTRPLPRLAQLGRTRRRSHRSIRHRNSLRPGPRRSHRRGTQNQNPLRSVNACRRGTRNPLRRRAHRVVPRPVQPGVPHTDPLHPLEDTP